MTDISETIARAKWAADNAAGNFNTVIRISDLRALLDAAEAGVLRPATRETMQRIKDMGDERDARVRDAALEEAATLADHALQPGLAAAIRALKGRPT